MSLEGKSEDEIKGLANALLGKVREKGGVAGNIWLLGELRRDGWNEDTYWSVRDRLLDAGQLVLGRGKGGSVHIVESQPTPAEQAREETAASQPEKQAAEELATEDQLYEPIANVLRDRWVKDNRFRERLVEITAKQEWHSD